MLPELDFRRRTTAALLLWIFVPVASEAAEPAPTRVLRLDVAQAAALAANPDLEAAAAELRARDAATRQAALRPNPDLVLEVEDVAGSGAYHGVEEAQTTLGVVQTFELGGDRAARTAVAARQRDLARFDADAKRLDLLAETTSAFVEVLIAQEELRNVTALLDLVRAERRAMGADAARALEGGEARLAETAAEIRVSRGRAQLDTARRVLASVMGVATLDYAAAEGDLERGSQPPALDALLARIGENPDLARFGAERAEREANLALARASRIPDPQVGAGARHFAGTGDAALVFEVGIPLPLFDLRQGAIREASERVAAAASERAAVERQLRRDLIAGHGRWVAAQQELRTIRDELLPIARRALDALRAAHRRGAASELDVLDAGHMELANVDRMLAVLREYYETRVVCERLVGGFVGELR